jgi:hypothetical protein
MAVSNKDDIEKVCSRIYTECESLYTWKWDDRFQSVLSEFPTDSEHDVVSVLDKYFENCWNEETINDAPGKVKSVAKDLGDVREGQLLFSTDPEGDSLLLGAFWPWRNGKKISLRILLDVPEIELGSGAEISEGIQSPIST